MSAAGGTEGIVSREIFVGCARQCGSAVVSYACSSPTLSRELGQRDSGHDGATDENVSECRLRLETALQQAQLASVKFMIENELTWLPETNWMILYARNNDTQAEMLGGKILSPPHSNQKTQK